MRRYFETQTLDNDIICVDDISLMWTEDEVYEYRGDKVYNIKITLVGQSEDKLLNYTNKKKRNSDFKSIRDMLLNKPTNTI